MTIRAPSVAGSFYPADPALLNRQLDEFLRAAATDPVPAKAIIAPHAGYIYSGPVAATAYAAIAHLADQLRRVILIGPAHRLAFSGIAGPLADGFATPLGVVSVDRVAVAGVIESGAVQVIDQAFDGEHDLEVQLPFLQRLFPNAAIVPLLVGHAESAAIERVLAELWGGPETLILVSSDLSHFHHHQTARRLDAATAQTIEALAPEPLSGDSACGYRAIAGLLRRAAALDLRATALDLRNSGDTAGGHDRVVGYGAFCFEYATQARLAERDRATLKDVAQAALAEAADHGRPLDLDPGEFSRPLQARRRTFVTLEVDGKLRGCIGSVIASRSLVADVATNTFRAATQDPRFGGIDRDELTRISVTIAILSHSRPIAMTGPADLLAALQPDVDGLILRDGANQALFLPKVWHDLPDPREFVGYLKRKADLPSDHFSPTLQAFRFSAESF